MQTKTHLFSLVIIAMLFIAFKNDKKDPLSKMYVFIPMGSTDIEGNSYSVSAFWMQDHEVTNAEYRQFINDLIQTNDTVKLSFCSIDSTQWTKEIGKHGTPLTTYYHQHPAYDNYPVLNISYKAAVAYCEWLSEKSDNGRTYRLPSEVEWIYAAKGGFDHCNYAWPGDGLYNQKGEKLCNFKAIGDTRIHTNEKKQYEIITNKKDDNTSFTVPSVSYKPNEYGLYNMCGNVAEMISENGIALGGCWNSTGYDVRVNSKINYDRPLPYVGFRPVADYINE